MGKKEAFDKPIARKQAPALDQLLAMLSLPPLYDDFQVVHVRSLAAALAKLNDDFSMEHLLKVVHEEDEAQHDKLTPEVTRHHAASSKRKPTPDSCPLSDNEPVIHLQSSSSQPGQLPASIPRPSLSPSLALTNSPAPSHRSRQETESIRVPPTDF